jgi:single-stranded-DNA-specific exonuclease
MLGRMEQLSVTGQRWVLAEAPAAASLAQKLGVAEIIARVLCARQPQAGVEDMFRFLSPQFSHLPDPAHLLDMDKAVARIYQAVQQGEKIAVFGDYDVDGACATALFIRYFRAMGKEIEVYIPNRLEEGYGPNVPAMEKLAAAGVKLIITVDCGSTAHQALQVAQAAGVDVVVTDHHQCPAPFPPCHALVNPNRVDEESPCSMLCGAGVVFYVLMALNRALREAGMFEDMAEPDLRQWLDLVAVATVCDMVPLTGVNRVLVTRGLEGVQRRQNLGLATLLELLGQEDEVETYHLGFQIGPRLNAAGRLAESDLGARFLALEDAAQARQLADRLHKLNKERQNIQEEVLTEALAQAQGQAEEAAILVAGEGWHPGVVGIVAARIKEKFYRPAFVLAVGADGTATGSARSIPGVDVGRAVLACQEYLERGGGHAMAAGVTVRVEKVEDFRKAMIDHIVGQVVGQATIFTPRLRVDGLLSPAAATPELLENLARLAPYGMGHRAPVFVTSGVILQDVRSVGKDGSHLKLRLQGADGSTLGGIAFGAMETPLGPFLQRTKGQKISLAGRLEANTYGGVTRPDFQVQDAREGAWSG